MALAYFRQAHAEPRHGVGLIEFDRLGEGGLGGLGIDLGQIRKSQYGLRLCIDCGFKSTARCAAFSARSR